MTDKRKSCIYCWNCSLEKVRKPADAYDVYVNFCNVLEREISVNDAEKCCYYKENAGLLEAVKELPKKVYSYEFESVSDGNGNFAYHTYLVEEDY